MLEVDINKEDYLTRVLAQIIAKYFALTMNLSQKSPKSGRSIAFKLSFVAASTLTYNCMYESEDLLCGKFAKLQIHG